MSCRYNDRRGLTLVGLVCIVGKNLACNLRRSLTFLRVSCVCLSVGLNLPPCLPACSLCILLLLLLLLLLLCGPGYLSRCSDWLRAGQSGDRFPVGGEIFRSRPDRRWGPPSLLYSGYQASYLGVKRPGRGVDHPLSSSTEIKERVELYLCSPSPSVLYGRLLSHLYLLPYYYYYYYYYYYGGKCGTYGAKRCAYRVLVGNLKVPI